MKHKAKVRKVDTHWRASCQKYTCLWHANCVVWENAVAFALDHHKAMKVNS